MKNIKLLCGVMLLAGVSISGTALAEHGHVGVGLYFGVPFPGYYYPPPYYPYPYPYPYYPPVVVETAPAQPPVYVEQGNPQLLPPQQAPAPQAGSYWYHCDNPEGYYPYIKECPGGWQKVVPTPPPQQ